MKSKIITIIMAYVCMLSLSSFAGGGIETITTTASADTGATVTASTVLLSGTTLEAITFKCGTNTGTAIVDTVPKDTAVPGYTLITTNITGNVTVFPRVEGEKPFLHGESLLVTVTNAGASNVTFQATIKLSK